jgi:PBP1b-binding outer membrane lipoprotein LpoB
MTDLFGKDTTAKIATKLKNTCNGKIEATEACKTSFINDISKVLYDMADAKSGLTNVDLKDFETKVKGF